VNWTDFTMPYQWVGQVTVVNQSAMRGLYNASQIGFYSHKLGLNCCEWVWKRVSGTAQAAVSIFESNVNSTITSSTDTCGLRLAGNIATSGMAMRDKTMELDNTPGEPNWIHAGWKRIRSANTFPAFYTQWVESSYTDLQQSDTNNWWLELWPTMLLCFTLAFGHLI